MDLGDTAQEPAAAQEQQGFQDALEQQPRELRRTHSWALGGSSPRESAGGLYVWGRNDLAQLGSTLPAEGSTEAGGQPPTQLLPSHQVVDVAGSTFCSAFVTGLSWLKYAQDVLSGRSS